MLPRSWIIFFILLISITGFSQPARLSGKVANEKNEPIQGVTIQVTKGPGTSSQLDGSYQIHLDPGTYEIVFSAIGYETRIVTDVTVKAGQLNELNIVLLVAAKEQSGVVITARSSQRRETVNALLQFQKNTHTVASVISAESIRRSPDRNTGEVLKRTPGASLQEGRFLVIRGLADRYNQAMLNGILLTSTEPDRKTFSFDLIPAPMIDHIVINKAFVPEYPGEWAGGLVQVNTKDIPTRNFLNIQAGTGLNTQTTGRVFYKDKSGSLDWLGIDDGSRGLPEGYTTKSKFDALGAAEKTAIGKRFRNAWRPQQTWAAPHVSFLANGGFSTRLLGKRTGVAFGIFYNRNDRYQKLQNRSHSLAGGIFSLNYDYDDDRYVQDVTAGAMANMAVQLNSLNRISLRSIVNLNSSNAVILRHGEDLNRGFEVSGAELSFKQNSFFTTQLTGEHGLARALKLKWYGAFNILDGYIPDQRRILYARAGAQEPWRLLISNTLSQQSGSRIYQALSDYIYTAGGDLHFSFDLFGQKQSLKTGYMLQVKDRLYDAKLFANYLPVDNDALRQLPASEIFSPENFGDGTDNKFGFDAIKGSSFRYLANTILNAGYIQFDNQLTEKFRLVWGLRAEHYDQLSGSVKAWDPRHTHSKVLDLLPGANAMFRLNEKTNLRLSASRTVIRPELRELSFLNLYDFELNASVQGNPLLKRTAVSNLDLRYEWYPRAGEVLTAGLFYKYFKYPIEQLFNEGVGGASTFSYQNAEEARSYGVEMEIRKKLDFVRALRHFSFTANAAYVYSRVQDANFQIDRPLQGQSPYLINLGLMYDLEKIGLTSTVLFNQVGERIYLVGDLSAGAGSPDIYEASRPLLDFQLSKKLWNNQAEIRMNISDILNQRQYFYQNANDNNGFNRKEDALRFTRKFGTSINISFNYSL